MKLRNIKHTFWWVTSMERMLFIKVKPLPRTRFVGRGVGTVLKELK